jgi:hypothetical protein
MVGRVRAVEPADLWATSFVPGALLPGAQLESVLQAALARQRPSGDARRLRLARMERFVRPQAWGAVVGSGAGNMWTILGDDGRTALTLDGLDYA